MHLISSSSSKIQDQAPDCRPPANGAPLRMKDFAGTPGTRTALALRIAQLTFAVGSMAFLVSTKGGFDHFTAFRYLNLIMFLQVIWSSVAAMFNADALVRKKVQHTLNHVVAFAALDLLFGTLSLGVASASAGNLFFFDDKRGHKCKFGEECMKYHMAVALAFMTWLTTAISALIMLWLLAAA